MQFNNYIKQTRQEHNNLATIQRPKLKGAHERSKALQYVKILDSKCKAQQGWLE